ncbi:MAG: DUF4185 domain-containing protein [Gemmatimonadetes bacterium]|jgi:hypothetical protein|nr:DUF4185 domain-containing protein [Gemmatimonadota bacterium]MBT4612562.1 DUF4185 domain-containing protein [Gemmatimonadota bacterium]MBT5057739.1 DUF4185 domain-containing protein [Gemmatimonadota bacterium]MBT5141349.1 DUF4185 domain-containing protein [Gemmatimonadota bacterium]MBT5590430.1 DUF4185 domain-containing protein [Gemmatimonadota bacterium]
MPTPNTPSVPEGITLHTDTLYRSAEYGDNWCITWADDDSQITSMDDGDWLGSRAGGENRRGFHNRLYRIIGDARDFERQELTGYPDFSGPEGSWFGYGIICVDGVVYSAASRTPGDAWSGPFRGIKLLKSADGGQSWSRVDRHGAERRLAADDEARNLDTAEEMFSLEEFGRPHLQQSAYPFSFVDFVQHGQNNGLAPDDYIYVYGPEGAHAHELLLARVEKSQLGERDKWRYWSGEDAGRPVWSPDIEQRRPVHVFPDRSAGGDFFGWYSWLPSVVFNPGLGLYIMVNGGTYAGRGLTSSDEDYYDKWMHTKTGSLGFWYAENPWGPWQQFYYTDYWTADDPGNLTYQPKLSPKWISEDGREMVLIWSDAMKDDEGKSHTVNYKWNQMAISLH